MEGITGPMLGAGLAHGSGLADAMGSGSIDTAGMEASAAMDAIGAIVAGAGLMTTGSPEAIGMPLAMGPSGHGSGEPTGSMDAGAALGITDASWARPTLGSAKHAAMSKPAPSRVRRDIAHLA